MAQLSYSELLKHRGWTESATPDFAEKAGAGASVYFNFRNEKGSHLTLAVFPAEGLIRFRVYDPKSAEVRWLQIGIDQETDAVVSKIVARQSELTAEGMFTFYFSLSEFENVSILAWEQYEEGYR